MPKYIFKKEKDRENRFDNTTVEIAVETESRDEILPAFEEFLRGCGFYIKDTIEVVMEEADDKE